MFSFSYFPAENLIEYKWPPDETGEYYMLQEQVSEYLGVTSFKRKYPGIHVKNTYMKCKNIHTVQAGLFTCLKSASKHINDQMS